MQHSNGSVPEYNVAGQTYPPRIVRPNASCAGRASARTSTAPCSTVIPGLVAEKFSGSGLTARNIRDHRANRHVPIDAAARDMLVADAPRA